MLFITFKYSCGSTFTKSWHTGMPVLGEHTTNNAEVEDIQADGDELLYILNHFKNIPTPPSANKIAWWYGDTARFIVANLRGL